MVTTEKKENESESFTVKTVNDYKEVEEVKVKVWAVKTVIGVLSYAVVALIAAVLYHLYMNPSDDTLVGKTINNVFKVIEYIFKGLE